MINHDDDAPDSEQDADELEERLRPELDEALLALDELAQENPEEALSMFDSLPVPVQTLPEFQLLLARAHQTMGQLAAARDLIQGVLDKDDLASDAHHLLGDVLEDLGEVEEANKHFLATLSLDATAFAEVSAEDKEILVTNLQSILADLCGTLPNGQGPDVDVQLLPSAETVRSGLDPRALTSFAKKNGRPTLTVYAANMDAEFGDLIEYDEFAPHVRAAGAQEIASHLQLSKKQIADLGWDKFVLTED